MARPQAKEIVMRPSRFLPVMFAWLALLLIAVSAGPAQTVIDIYNFTGQNSSAAPSEVTPAQGRDGNLYGTTYGQGGSNYGTIFKVTLLGRSSSSTPLTARPAPSQTPD